MNLLPLRRGLPSHFVFSNGGLVAKHLVIGENVPQAFLPGVIKWGLHKLKSTHSTPRSESRGTLRLVLSGAEPRFKNRDLAPSAVEGINEIIFLTNLDWVSYFFLKIPSPLNPLNQ